MVWAFLAVALAASPARAVPFDWGGRDWEGCAELVDLARSELGPQRVIVTSRLDLHALEPTDGVVIIHPQKTLDVEGYARFLRAGGRVVLLDDYGTGDALLTHFGMERVPMPEHPAESLRGNPALAIAEPAGIHPVVNDVARVVTNHATGIRHPDLTPVLQVRPASGEHGTSPSGNRPVLLAVAGAVSNGRLLAVGDSSIVMNSMLRYAGNKMFARNLLHYAADDEATGQGHGKGRVFLVEGSFEQIGTFGDDADANGVWSERMRALRDALASVRAEGFPPNMAYLFAVLVGLGIVMWTGSRAGRTHKAATPRFTRSIPLAQQGGVAGHAALIGAARTPRILAMLELKSALEEELCTTLGMDNADHMPGHEELTSALAARRWVAPEVIAHLRSLLLRMAQVETMMLSQRSGATMAPVRDREVLSASKEVNRILLAVREGHARPAREGAT
ncbi:MAG: DUF4350 domain-containing protein [Polyangiaceae bacterium]